MSLLSLLENGASCSIPQLAEALGTSVQMVQAKLERYVQLGLVKRVVVSSSCGADCSKCGGCKDCSGAKNNVPMVYWEIVR